MYVEQRASDLEAILHFVLLHIGPLRDIIFILIPVKFWLIKCYFENIHFTKTNQIPSFDLIYKISLRLLYFFTDDDKNSSFYFFAS